ncbi:MAG: hypothetical protein V3U53_02605 [bacterium]
MFDNSTMPIKPDGYLILGASEGIFGVTDRFKRQVDGKSVTARRHKQGFLSNP